MARSLPQSIAWNQKNCSGGRSYQTNWTQAPALIIFLLTDVSGVNVPSGTSFEPPGRASFHTVRVNSKRRAEAFFYRLF